MTDDWRARARELDPRLVALALDVVERIDRWYWRATAKVPDWGWYSRTGEYRSRQQGLPKRWITLDEERRIQEMFRSLPCAKSLSLESEP